MTENNAQLFLRSLIQEIENKDILHSKKIKKNLSQITQYGRLQFDELLNMIFDYFSSQMISPSLLAIDYLKMINDMRKEGIYFLKNGVYSCENQSVAYEKVYSRKDIMSYYMNALLISQILWKHHFDMFIYFRESLKKYYKKSDEISILDVGPGHGFFSYIIKTDVPNFFKLDIVDISESSLIVTKQIIGDKNEKIFFFKEDIFNFDSPHKYDLIILGEVLEHLDNPIEILQKLSNLLSENGVLWLTTPTNSPALDHVYLFKSKEEVVDLITLSGFDVTDLLGCYSEDVSEEIAKKNKVTQLIGAFCKKKL